MIPTNDTGLRSVCECFLACERNRVIIIIDYKHSSSIAQMSK